MNRLPHLVAAAAAILAAVAGALAYTLYASHTENKYIHAVAALDHAEISRGIAAERAAIRQPDLLLIYGASELVLLETKYEATRFFSTYPTGFMVFNAATKGGSSLTVAQRLAALGPDLKGRRVIFAIGPAIMTMAPFGDVAERHYEGNFSELHALELAFNPHLSLETKSIAARRMLEFPETLQSNALLVFHDAPAGRSCALEHRRCTTSHGRSGSSSWPFFACRITSPPCSTSIISQPRR